MPETAEEFWKFAGKGCELRKLHLMESPELDTPLTSYPISGNNVVEKVVFKSSTDIPVCDSSASSQGQTCDSNTATDRNVCATSGKAFINSTQYFENVHETAWNFYIGGYHPAQKWLKDRKSRALTYDDIIHYQRIIVALKRTAEIMEGIEKIRIF